MEPLLSCISVIEALLTALKVESEEKYPDPRIMYKGAEMLTGVAAHLQRYANQVNCSILDALREGRLSQFDVDLFLQKLKENETECDN